MTRSIWIFWDWFSFENISLSEKRLMLTIFYNSNLQIFQLETPQPKIPKFWNSILKLYNPLILQHLPMIEAEEVSALKNDLCLLSLLAISLSRIFCDGLMNPKLRADIVSKVLQLLESGKSFFSIIAIPFSNFSCIFLNPNYFFQF